MRKLIPAVKSSFFLICIFIFCVFSCSKPEKTYINSKKFKIILEDRWKFITGDSLGYAQPDFDDSDWEEILINKEWELQGYKDYDGYAWYRVTFTIPDSIREYAYPQNQFIISLGIVDDYDQVFLNGSLIGQNNKILSKVLSHKNSFTEEPGLSKIDRQYIFPIKDSIIEWNGKNVIAIRVYDKIGRGGMISGIPYAGMSILEDLITYNIDKFYLVNEQKKVDTVFKIKNDHTKLSYQGQFTMIAKNIETKMQILKIEQDFLIQPKDSILLPISLPVSLDLTSIYLEFRNKKSNVIIQDSAIIPYVLVK